MGTSGPVTERRRRRPDSSTWAGGAKPQMAEATNGGGGTERTLTFWVKARRSEPLPECARSNAVTLTVEGRRGRRGAACHPQQAAGKKEVGGTTSFFPDPTRLAARAPLMCPRVCPNSFRGRSNGTQRQPTEEKGIGRHRVVFGLFSPVAWSSNSRGVHQPIGRWSLRLSASTRTEVRARLRPVTTYTSTGTIAVASQVPEAPLSHGRRTRKAGGAHGPERP